MGDQDDKDRGNIVYKSAEKTKETEKLIQVSPNPLYINPFHSQAIADTLERGVKSYNENRLLER